MPFEMETTLKNMATHLRQDKASLFRKVQIGEPKGSPAERFTAALFMDRVGVAQLTLTDTIETHVVTIRIYDNMLREPQEDVEFEMARVVSRVMSDLAGEFDLGRTVRSVDVGGIYGTPLSSRWGFIDVSGTMYRFADITVPLIVDGSATLAA